MLDKRLALGLLYCRRRLTATKQSFRVVAKDKPKQPTDMKSKFLITTLLAGVISAGLALQSQATPIAPGAVVVPASGPVSGTLVTSLTGQVFGGQSTWNGTLDSWVYNNDPNNTNGASALTFVYQFHVTGGPDSVEGFTVGGWNGFLLDAYQTAGPGPNGTNGNHAADSLVRSASGNVLNWNFLGFNAVQPGQNSFYLIVRSNATMFTTGPASGQNGTAGNARALVANVPEGGSLLSAFGLALVGVEVLRRKLKRA